MDQPFKLIRFFCIEREKPENRFIHPEQGNPEKND
jgi:hypothetical protein